MIQIRKNVFETNSSMTHSLVLCKQKDYDDWTEGRAMFRYEDRTFLPNDEALKANGMTLRQVAEETKKCSYSAFSAAQYARCERILKNFTEENISLYERGEASAKKFGFYDNYDCEYYYITYKEWIDYVVHHLDFYDIYDSNVIDGVAVAVFGYFGHD